jgi:hypothetical protein
MYVTYLTFYTVKAKSPLSLKEENFRILFDI